MPMQSAQSAAGIVVRFTPHVGGCWKILDRRVRVESKLLYKKNHRQIHPLSCDAHETYPHCITTRVKKYTL